MNIFNVKPSVIIHNGLVLARLFIQTLKPRKPKNVSDVKGYYTQEHYDWITEPQFPEIMLHTRRREAMALKATQYITHTKVLDIACGTGLITQVLPGDVTGVDISPWKIERAKKHCPNVNFIVGDIENLNYYVTTHDYDVVVCTDALEHLEHPDRAIRGAYKCLKPEGIFIGTVPSKHLIWKFRRFLTTSDSSGEPFHNYYSRRQLADLLKPFVVMEITSECLGLELFFAARK